MIVDKQTPSQTRNAVEVEVEEVSQKWNLEGLNISESTGAQCFPYLALRGSCCALRPLKLSRVANWVTATS